MVGNFYKKPIIAEVNGKHSVYCTYSCLTLSQMKNNQSATIIPRWFSHFTLFTARLPRLLLRCTLLNLFLWQYCICIRSLSLSLSLAEHTGETCTNMTYVFFFWWARRSVENRLSNITDVYSRYAPKIKIRYVSSDFSVSKTTRIFIEVWILYRKQLKCKWISKFSRENNCWNETVENEQISK